jgi:hypothetical protein
MLIPVIPMVILVDGEVEFSLALDRDKERLGVLLRWKVSRAMMGPIISWFLSFWSRFFSSVLYGPCYGGDWYMLC